MSTCPVVACPHPPRISPLHTLCVMLEGGLSTVMCGEVLCGYCAFCPSDSRLICKIKINFILLRMPIPTQLSMVHRFSYISSSKLALLSNKML